MISEHQQDQAVLYALGLLDAKEAAEFERQMDAEPGLRDFVLDCKETSASLALAAADSDQPSDGLKHRIMLQLAAEPASDPGVGPNVRVPGGRRRARSKIHYLSVAVPWTLAALLMIFCGMLFVRAQRLERANDSLHASLSQVRAAQPPDLLTKVAFCQLEPTAAEAPAQPRVAVVWDAARQEGVVQVVQLTPPARGKDYQLWAVEDGHKDPVSAGLVHVDGQGRAQAVFKPAADANGRVLAFALSLERAGGSATNAGPILLVGKL